MGAFDGQNNQSANYGLSIRMIMLKGTGIEASQKKSSRGV